MLTEPRRWEYNKDRTNSALGYKLPRWIVIFKQGDLWMGDKGKKDKGKREVQKKAQLTRKEKKKRKEEEKNKQTPSGA